MVNQSNKILNPNITKLVNQTYQYGFSTNIEKDIIEKGLNEKTIKLISKKKKRNKNSFKLSFKSLSKLEKNGKARMGVYKISTN